MKYIYNIGVLLLTLWLGACQDDEALEGVQEGVSFEVSGEANEKLDQVVKQVHLLIYDETGKLVKVNEYEDLTRMAPVKLAIGEYTFAYLSNVESRLVEGMEVGKTMEELSISLDEQADTLKGDEQVPDLFFKGMDEVNVGEENRSSVTLQRMVGLLDLNVSGVGAGVKLKSVTLLGSPKKVRFSDGAGEAVRLNVPMQEGDGIKGKLLAFPTVDSVASLEFVFESAEGTQTFVTKLTNKLEANKILKINARSYVTGGLWELATDVELKPWETLSERQDLTALREVDALKVLFTFEDKTQVDLKKVKRIMLGYLYNQLGQTLSSTSNSIVVQGDTLICTMAPFNSSTHLYARRYIIQANYSEAIALQDGANNYIYRSRQSFVLDVDTNGVARVTLPAMKVDAGDLQAMLDLRNTLPAGHTVGDQWKRAGDFIQLWNNVEIENGRVVGIGSANASLSVWQDSVIASQQVWTIPESFKNLTALKYFVFSTTNPVTEIPAFLKELPALEQLQLLTTSRQEIPELPESLVGLALYTRAPLPAHIMQLKNLTRLNFQGNGCAASVDFSKLSALERLVLTSATETKCPDGVWMCSNLTQLDVRGFNQLQAPERIAAVGLTSLTLDMSSLQLDQIQFIKQITDRFQLTLLNGLFTTLPDWFDELDNLSTLILNGCDSLRGTLPEALKQRFVDRKLTVTDDSPYFTPDGVIYTVSIPNYVEFTENDRSKNSYVLRIPKEGATLSVKITTKEAWKITKQSGTAAVSISQTEGTGDATVTITFEAATGYKSANINLQITSGNNHTFRLNCTQF